MGKTKSSGAEMLRRGSGAGQAYMRMMRSGHFNRAIVYVEGESDIQFYRWIIDHSCVDLHQMEGKDAAMDAVMYANQKKEKGVLAFVDSDFDHILNIGPDTNVIRTDTHDIETLMISGGAFQYVRDDYVDTTKLEGSDYSADSLWNKVIEIAKAVGKIRLLSKANDWNMKFSSGGIRDKDNLEADGVIKLQNGEIIFDAHQYIYECINAASDCAVGVATVYEAYKTDSNEYDTWQICRGHDVSMIISILYSKTHFGKRNVYRDEIEKMITSTYIASRKFKKSKMYDDIKQWQYSNIGWKILSDEMM